jgi:hypothetical protein
MPAHDDPRQAILDAPGAPRIMVSDEPVPGTKGMRELVGTARASPLDSFPAHVRIRPNICSHKTLPGGQPPGPPLRDTVPQTPYEFMVCEQQDVGAYSSRLYPGIYRKDRSKNYETLL